MIAAAKTQTPVPQSAKWLVGLGIAASAIAATAVLYCCDPSQSRFYPICLFHYLTGLACPGCGALRALHRLFHGEWIEAFRLNAPLILALPFGGWTLAVFAAREIGGKQLPGLAMRPAAWWAVLAAAVAFWILRNLPWAPFSWFGL